MRCAEKNRHIIVAANFSEEVSDKKRESAAAGNFELETIPLVEEGQQMSRDSGCSTGDKLNDLTA